MRSRGCSRVPQVQLRAQGGLGDCLELCRQMRWWGIDRPGTVSLWGGGSGGLELSGGVGWLGVYTGKPTAGGQRES